MYVCIGEVELRGMWFFEEACQHQHCGQYFAKKNFNYFGNALTMSVTTYMPI